MHFSRKGTGPVIVLLHGFPLTSAIWEELTGLLSKDFTVVAFDLPGFGSSPAMPESFSIDEVAKKVNAEIGLLGLGDITLVGHSMGGYVALAMIEQNPKLFNRLVLFHSTPFADNEEKKANRDKVVSFVRNNGVETFTSNFIPPLFADKSSPLIDSIRKISVHATASAVIGYTLAMRDRSDKMDALRRFLKPVLMICGRADEIMKIESAEKVKSEIPEVKIKILEGAGHMAMVEKPKEAAEIIKSFIGPSNRP